MSEIYEIRCEYPVTVNRKKLWETELAILDDIDAICKENGLQYFLIGGGGIGAQRHQGFIPWDDDLDIGMIREDFEAFLKVFNESYKEKYCIQYGCGEYEECGVFLRIRNRMSTAIIRSQWRGYTECHGVFVEIYPFDTVTTSEKLNRKQLKRIKLYIRLLEHRFSGKTKRGIMSLPDKLLKLVLPTSKLWRKYNNECKRYNKSNSEWVDTPAIPIYAEKGIHKYKKNQVLPAVHAKFEDGEYCVPADNDACLKIHFGDYMKLPEVGERGMNHNRIVFFDPNKSYKEYLTTDIPDKYFAGEFDEII